VTPYLLACGQLLWRDETRQGLEGFCDPHGSRAKGLVYFCTGFFNMSVDAVASAIPESKIGRSWSPAIGRCGVSFAVTEQI
jgi:hypothetical protein